MGWLALATLLPGSGKLPTWRAGLAFCTLARSQDPSSSMAALLAPKAPGMPVHGTPV